MAEDQKFPAGSIQLAPIIITSDITGESFDLRPMVQEFSIYESVAAPFLTADMVVADALSLTTILPMVGQEMVNIKFRTPHPSVSKGIDVTMRVVSIENYGRLNARTARYVVHLASIEQFQNITTSIQQSFRHKPISDMVKEIHEDFLVSQKELTLSTTDGERTIVIPNMSPTKAISFLCREAFSTSYKASNFVYFENCDGFYFTTLDELIHKRRPVAIDKYYASHKNFDNPHASQRESLSSGRGGGAKQSMKPYDMLQMDEFQFHQLVNTDRTAVKGGWENSSYFIDPVWSDYTVKKYDYHQDFDDLRHTFDGTGGRLISGDNHMINTHQSQQNLFLTSKQGVNVDYDQKPEFYPLMVGSMGLIDSLLVDVTVPGDSSRRAGDIVRLEFPEYGGTTDVEGKINKYFSGKYLVLSVRHIYGPSGYYVSMQCAKNAYNAELVPHNPTESHEEQVAQIPEQNRIKATAENAEPVEAHWPDRA